VVLIAGIGNAAIDAEGVHTTAIIPQQNRVQGQKIVNTRRVFLRMERWFARQILGEGICTKILESRPFLGANSPADLAA
jgi:hypothetical protein